MAEPNYHNFDLFFQHEGDGYRVRADSPDGQATATFILPFSDIELQNFILTTRPGMRGVRRIDAPDVAAAKKFGGNLFQAVFNGDVQGIWRSSLSAASQSESRMRVRLRFTDTPELADLPWEYLFSTSLNRFLALDDELAIVRYLDMPERTRPVSVSLPLRVLVMISNPGDYPTLDVEQEWAQIREALGPLQERGLVQIDLLEDATLPVLRKKLQTASYHILHFIGHGAFDRQTQEGVLVLKDDNGRGRLVSGQQLGWLVHNYRTLALVILNACEGARADRTDPFSGTAQSLVQQGIPAVVAMQFEITDGAAKTFSQAFYSAIAGGHPVENALFEARMGIFTENHALEWATPVLYTRAADGHLFDISAAPVVTPQTTAPIPTVPTPEPPTTQGAATQSAVVEPVFEIEAQIQEIAPAVEPVVETPVVDNKREIAALYAAAQQAVKKRDWQRAAEKARAVLALDDAHNGAATILRDALKVSERNNVRNAVKIPPTPEEMTDAMAILSQLKDTLPNNSDVNTALSTMAMSANTAKNVAASDQTTLANQIAANQLATNAIATKTAAKTATGSGNGRVIGIGAAVGLVVLVLLVLVFVIKPGGQNGGVTGTPTPGSVALVATSTTLTGATDNTPTVGSVAENNTPTTVAVVGTDSTATVSPAETTEAAPTSDGSGSVSGAQGILRARMGYRPDSLDPQRAYGEAIGIVSLAYEALLGLNAKLEVVPAAAASWSVSPDGLQYTLKLQSNLKYSDGAPLTANNFVYAWKRLLDPRVASRPYSSLAYDIVGAQDLDQTDPTDTAKIEAEMNTLGVKAVDDSTIMFTLREPAPYFPYVLTLWIGDPVRQDLVEKGGVDWSNEAIGLYYASNGPFTLKQFSDESIELGANYNYRLGSPQLAEIDVKYIGDTATVLHAYRAGELDTLIVPPDADSQVLSDTSLSSELSHTTGNCTEFYAFNTTVAPFNNVKVRQAIASALNRDDFDKSVLYGLGQQATSIIPPNETGYDPNINTLVFDPAGAKALLASAGYPDGQNFPAVTIKYPQEDVTRMQWLQVQLKSVLNINITLQVVDPTDYSALYNDLSTVPGVHSGSWCSAYNDPHASLTMGFNSFYAAQQTGWASDQFDRLTVDADITQDPAKRLDMYKQAHALLLTEASIIPMDYTAVISLVKPKVSNWSGFPNYPELLIPGLLNIFNIQVAP